MSFVVVDTNTRCLVAHPRTGTRFYGTRALAKAAATRLLKIATKSGLGDASRGLPRYEVMDGQAYEAQVPMVEVTNLMTGKTVMERADTPWHCSVASEAYWSG